MPEEKEYLDSEENLVPMPKLNKRLKFKIIHSEEKEVVEAAKLIKNFCNKRSECDMCPLDKCCNDLKIKVPFQWQLKEE